MVPSARPHFLGAIMVVDVDALAGLTPIQLADYAAMRGFAQTMLEGPGRLTTPTILHVIDTPMGSKVPLTMTEWDFSFLKALYGSDGRNYAAPAANRDAETGQARSSTKPRGLRSRALHRRNFMLHAGGVEA